MAEPKDFQELARRMNLLVGAQANLAQTPQEFFDRLPDGSREKERIRVAFQDSGRNSITDFFEQGRELSQAEINQGIDPERAAGLGKSLFNRSGFTTTALGPIPQIDAATAKVYFEEVTDRITNRLRGSNVPVTGLLEDRIDSLLVEHLANPLHDIGETGSLLGPTPSGVDNLILQSLSTEEETLARFPSSPTNSLRFAEILFGGSQAENTGISQEILDLILVQEDALFNIPPEQRSDLEQSAIDVINGIADNQQAIIDRAVQNGARGDLSDAGREIALRETEDVVLAGENLYPVPESIDSIQARRNREQLLSELDFDENASKAVKAYLEERGISIDPALQNTPDSKKGITRTASLISSDVSRHIQQEKQRNPGITQDQLTQSVIDFLDDAIPSNEEFNSILEDNTAQIRASRVQNPSEAKAEANKLLFQMGIDPSSITDGAFASIQKQISEDGGITRELKDGLTSSLAAFQQEKSNQDFVEQSPQKRAEQIAREFGLTTPRFLDTASSDQVKAFQNAQNAQIERIDTQLQNGIQSNPFFNRRTFTEGAFSDSIARPSLGNEDLLAEDPNFGTLGSDQAERLRDIRRFRESQPSSNIPGDLPFDVPGSISQQQQFGDEPPTDLNRIGETALAGRFPVGILDDEGNLVATREDGTRITSGPPTPTNNRVFQRRGRGQPQLSQVDPDAITRQIDTLSGGDEKLRTFALSRVGDVIQRNRDVGRTRLAEEREAAGNLRFGRASDFDVGPTVESSIERRFSDIEDEFRKRERTFANENQRRRRRGRNRFTGAFG